MERVQPDRPSPLWAGKILALVGIAIVALGLRTGVAVVSPILDRISVDVPLSPVAFGVVGMLAPVSFAVFGLMTPLFARRLGLERTLLIALCLSVVGHVARGLSGSYEMFLGSTAVILAGVGVGNVLLPPLVKRYFPDRIGSMTALTTALMSVSTALPALVAAPLAANVGWRLTLGMWALVSAAALLPWLSLYLRHRREQQALDDSGEARAVPETRIRLNELLRSKVAWAIATIFAVSSLNAYAMFIWLPQILLNTAGLGSMSAGALLSLYSFAGFPAGLLVPVLAARMRNVGILIYVAVGFLGAGMLGLVLMPATLTWMWVLFAGLGPLLFPLALVLVNLRTRSHAGAVALSGFTQGVGYTFGSLGPLLVGLLHQFSGGWLLPELLLLGTGVAAAISGFILTRPSMLEDDVDRIRASRLARQPG